MVIQAVVAGINGSIRVMDCEMDLPGPGEVRLRLEACGICHTDLLAIDGELGTPKPMIAGHEGVGVIEALGEGCDGFAMGDRVLTSYAACRECPSCRGGAPAYCRGAFALNFLGRRVNGDGPVRVDGRPVTSQFFGQSSFATHTVVAARNLVPLPPDIPAALAAPMACGVQTGMSTVMDVLDVQPGERLAVFGCGAVGLAAVMAGVLRGCERIVAVDLRADRLALAAELGATETVQVGVDTGADPWADVAQVDAAVDAVGTAAVMEKAFGLLDRRGRLACVGVGPVGDRARIDARELVFSGRSIRGSIEGDADPREFVPRMIDHWRAGELPLEKLVETYPLSQAARALQALRAGDVIKPVLQMNPENGDE